MSNWAGGVRDGKEERAHPLRWVDPPLRQGTADAWHPVPPPFGAWHPVPPSGEALACTLSPCAAHGANSGSGA